MSKFEILMPKLGESVQEATITKWFKKVGDQIEDEEALLEIATDKVDSEIPSPVDGVVEKILFEEDALVPVGEVIAIINLSGEVDESATKEDTAESGNTKVEEPEEEKQEKPEQKIEGGTRFYSPLVKSIAKEEGISIDELETITGTGANGRVKKEDVLEYIKTRGSQTKEVKETSSAKPTPSSTKAPNISVNINAGDEVVEMDRMRKIIAAAMVKSKQVSPHVTNMLEIDVTDLVIWRNKVKGDFEKRQGFKLTFLPIMIEATAKALKDFPGVNASIDGDNIIYRKKVNVGIAVALPSGNLIVPNIKDADQRNLLGIATEMNRIVTAARDNKLSPDDIAGGTFSISNFGSFRNDMGTPIINQPEVAILATGNIVKKPAVLETPSGDVIAIRHKMWLSLTYDHRAVDGALGGGFLRKLGDYLEQFNLNTSI